MSKVAPSNQDIPIEVWRRASNLSSPGSSDQRSQFLSERARLRKKFRKIAIVLTVVIAITLVVISVAIGIGDRQMALLYAAIPYAILYLQYIYYRGKIENKHGFTIVNTTLNKATKGEVMQNIYDNLPPSNPGWNK